MKRWQKKHKRIFCICSFILGLACIALCVIFAKSKNMEYIGDEEIPLSYNDLSLVMETEVDYRVIPDKYNTGASGELTVIGLGDMVEGIQLVADGSGTRNVLDFFYRNKNISGSIIIENMDFSAYPIMLYHSDKVENPVTIIFNNCKFSMVSTGIVAGVVSCEFTNCTFNCFTGSNASFYRCKFGDHYSDCIVPYQNVSVQDCFVSNMSFVKTEPGEEHSDGTHLYGHTNTPLYNITYDNCRFEIPSIELAGSNASVNTCFMLQLEYNNASDISMSNCILNGGGYSIYAWARNDKYAMQNVWLQNIKVGCAKKYGIFYPRISNDVVIENVVETDSLYVASVWKDNNQTHFSVTNDTNQERKLIIISDKGRFEYFIPACPRGEELSANGRYEDLPFDLDIVVPADCEYAVCYDAFLPGAAKQIRFVNWTGENIYLTSDEVYELFSGKEDVWYSGQCGKDVWYELDKTGVLTIRGSGETDNFHSAKRAPWYECREFVKQVIIEDGVTGLGTQLFKDCASLQCVSIPEGLLRIGQRAFDNCVALKTVYWPSTLVTVEVQAFAYTFMDSIQYAGTDIYEIVSDNGNLEDIMNVLEYVTVTEEGIPGEIVLTGECGDNCYYTLYSEGTLLIEGTGEMNNYHSQNTAPWYDSREEIYSVVIAEGIEKIGNQAFRKCNNLSEVSLPDSLICIGANAFIDCVSLTSICLPNHITEIQAWAFSGTGIVSTFYFGTQEQWNNIQIGSRNDKMLNNVIFLE